MTLSKDKYGPMSFASTIDPIDLSFGKSNEIHSLSRQIEQLRALHREKLVRVHRELFLLARSASPSAELHCRVKTIQSIIHKMRAKRLDIDKVLDFIGFRIILSHENECYPLVKRIHRKFKIVEFDDYIRNPKPNGYRSLHTTILCSNACPVEIQVRTRQMHEFAEHGAAAHSLYKQRPSTETMLDLIDAIDVRADSSPGF